MELLIFRDGGEVGTTKLAPVSLARGLKTHWQSLVRGHLEQ